MAGRNDNPRGNNPRIKVQNNRSELFQKSSNTKTTRVGVSVHPTAKKKSKTNIQHGDKAGLMLIRTLMAYSCLILIHLLPKPKPKWVMLTQVKVHLTVPQETQ